MMDFDADFAAPSDWARFYRGRGLQIVPGYLPAERPADWKRPLIRWREFETTKIPDTLFEQWYGPQGEHVRRPNMGIICGDASDRVFVLDLDTHKTPQAMQWWTGLVAVHENGMPPETPRQTTGGGGKQMLFRAPEGWISPTCRTSIGVDIRGQGGFAVIAPSLHASGSLYRWDEGCAPWDVEVADAPQWLCEAIDSLVEEHGGSRGTAAAPRVQTTATADFDAFGNQTDGREDYMTRVVWGAVLDLRRTAPMKPGEKESMAAMKAAYDVYVSKVRTRLTHLDNETGLETEGRGLSLFQEKWAAAMRQWDTKVAEEASKPKPEGERPFSPGEDPPPETAAPRQRARIELVPWDDLPDIAVAWQIRDFIPQGGLVALYGKPGSYKSFVALYLAACIGSTMDAFGRPTNHGDVVYIAGEGGAGLKKRRDAFMRHYGLPAGTRVRFIRAQLDLRSTAEDAKAVVAAIEALGIAPTMVIIDTLARAFAGGNENASEDMGAFIRQVSGMQDALGGPTVLLVHHSGKDEARGMRGHSALLGAVDTELEVVKLSEDNSPTRTGKMTVTKQKDGEDGYDLSYRLELVSLSPFGGEMDTGNASLVVVPDDAVGAPTKVRKPNLTDNDRVALAALELAAEDTDRHPGLEAIPRDVVPARTELWRRTFYQMSAHEPETRRKVFGRAQERLTATGTVRVWGEWSWISGTWK